MSMRSRALLLSFVLLVSCRIDRGDNQARTPAAGEQETPSEWFTDRAQQTGADFVHFNGMSGRFYLPEIIGPGVAMFDYDNDGDLDMYLVQGQMLAGDTSQGGARSAPPDSARLRDRLYRNDLRIDSGGTRTLHFTDVTDESRIVSRGYGMGVAAGDFDNNGCIDLYVTRFGPNQMFRNNCDGTFADASKTTGTDGPGWSVSASFFDFDRDGWLDLYVGHYLNFKIETNTACFSVSGTSDYCSPQVYRPQPDRLFRNQRDGTFADVTASAFVPIAFGPTLGVTTADFDADGWPDIYIANDGQPNQLWMNQGNGTFKNRALLAGVALTAEGKAEASMGVDAGDFDNDGDEDLFVTELTGEGSNLYVNDGSGMFEDRSAPSGLGPASLPYTGFGTAWFDLDNDGWLDVLAVNGAVRIIPALEQAKDPFPLHQRNQLFRNLGTGRFEDVTERAGAVFTLSEVGRGAAFGDVDNDGDVDVLVGNNNGPNRLLINNVGNRRHWVGLRLMGEHVTRDMLGARVGIVRNGRPTLWRRVRSDGSYGSANDPRVLVGLGDSTEVPRVRVVWPDSRVEEWRGIAIDRWTTLKEGGAR
jgi:enediyne biosynthesis protein E4